MDSGTPVLEVQVASGGYKAKFILIKIFFVELKRFQT